MKSHLELARIILLEGKGISCSLLQRRLKVDYYTAHKLMKDLGVPVRTSNHRKQAPNTQAC